MHLFLVIILITKSLSSSLNEDTARINGISTTLPPIRADITSPYLCRLSLLALPTLATNMFNPHSVVRGDEEKVYHDGVSVSSVADHHIHVRSFNTELIIDRINWSTIKYHLTIYHKVLIDNAHMHSTAENKETILSLNDSLLSAATQRLKSFINYCDNILHDDVWRLGETLIDLMRTQRTTAISDTTYNDTLPVVCLFALGMQISDSSENISTLNDTWSKQICLRRDNRTVTLGAIYAIYKDQLTKLIPEEGDETGYTILLQMFAGVETLIGRKQAIYMHQLRKLWEVIDASI